MYVYRVFWTRDQQRLWVDVEHPSEDEVEVEEDILWHLRGRAKPVLVIEIGRLPLT